MIVDGSESLAAYNYLGENTAVQIQYPLANVMLDLWGGTSGVYNGFDRFGRIIDQRWINYIGGTVDIDRYKYGYDRNSNRTWKENTVSKALGTPVYLDEFYTYDNLNRLTVMKRGQLTGSPPTGISGTPTKEQDWTLDKTGNWSNFTTKTTGTTDLNQTRTSNTVNELTGFTTSTGTAWATPAYDAAGNTITMPQPSNLGSSYTAVYDAWNRMVKISASSTTVAEYQYDGRGRRSAKLTYSAGTLSETRHFYWSNDWQDLEERVGTATTADQQYVWGVRYVDELICRDDAMPARYYALQDANFNLTAITNASGVVQERYEFYPYGQRLITDASWSSRSASSYDWAVGHQGLAHDPNSGLIYNRKRYLHPMLGRFEKRDPREYAGGISLYEYVRGNPIVAIDAIGDLSIQDYFISLAYSGGFSVSRTFFIGVLGPGTVWLNVTGNVMAVQCGNCNKPGEMICGSIDVELYWSLGQVASSKEQLARNRRTPWEAMKGGPKTPIITEREHGIGFYGATGGLPDCYTGLDVALTGFVRAAAGVGFIGVEGEGDVTIADARQDLNGLLDPNRWSLSGGARTGIAGASIELGIRGTLSGCINMSK